MGWKYEVATYIRRPYMTEYEYEIVHTGNSLIKAIIAMIKFRKTTGALRLVIR